MRKFALALIGLVASAGVALAAPDALRIGVLGDETGPYSSIGGPGSIVAAQMAVSDFGGKVAGRSIDIISADMQDKPDVAATIARKWFDTEGVDAIVDLPVSSVALAVNEIGREKKKIIMTTGASSEDLIGKACSPYTVQWLENNRALAQSTVKAVMASGGTKWFFLTPDFVFGHQMEAAARQAIQKAGGKVSGSIQYPLSTVDFSSYLVTAAASDANVFGLSSAGKFAISAIKQAKEFGLATPDRRVVAFLLFIGDVNALGLANAQGLYTPSGFYWDESDQTRAWAKRFFASQHRMPTRVQAYTYATVLHYLKAVAAVGSSDADAVSRKMKEMPVDFFGKKITIRPNGRVAFDLTLYQVKAPSESHYAWDYYKKIRTIPADEAFESQQNSACHLPAVN